jgi:UDP:flavonoid glycosyltransferase YjiC (YdhE family)
MLALGARLAERGHEVVLETWKRWGDDVEANGMRFVAAPEYPVFPTRERPLKPYEAVVLATAETRPAVAQLSPHVVVHDILTLAPAMAGELEGVPVATLIPHVYPPGAPGLPPYALGARMPRTALGAKLWGALDPLVQTGLRRGRSELNETRGKLGLPSVPRLHGGLSESLCIVATFPQLEYPRRWPASPRVVGPLMWEPAFGPAEPPPGDDPLVLVAPSTAQDPEHRMLRAALAGLADEPVRVLGTWNRRLPTEPIPVPANARLVEWVSYSRTMPDCALVICHAGHGTLVRALACGCPVVCVPHAGDMAENAARADWAGVGVRLPWRLLSPFTLRLAVRRALARRSLAARARELAAWAEVNDGASLSADLIERLATGERVSQTAGRPHRGSSSTPNHSSARPGDQTLHCR